MNGGKARVYRQHTWMVLLLASWQRKQISILVTGSSGCLTELCICVHRIGGVYTASRPLQTSLFWDKLTPTKLHAPLPKEFLQLLCLFELILWGARRASSAGDLVWTLFSSPSSLFAQLRPLIGRSFELIRVSFRTCPRDQYLY